MKDLVLPFPASSSFSNVGFLGSIDSSHEKPQGRSWDGNDLTHLRQFKPKDYDDRKYMHRM